MIFMIEWKIMPPMSLAANRWQYWHGTSLDGLFSICSFISIDRKLQKGWIAMKWKPAINTCQCILCNASWLNFLPLSSPSNWYSVLNGGCLYNGPVDANTVHDWAKKRTDGEPESTDLCDQAWSVSQQSTRNIKLVKDNQWINQRGTVVKLSISQESIGYIIGSVCKIDSLHVTAEMKALTTEICQ